MSYYGSSMPHGSFSSHREPQFIPGHITEEPFEDSPHEIFLSVIRCNDPPTKEYFFQYRDSDTRVAMVAVVAHYKYRYLLRGLGGTWGSLGRKHYGTIRSKKLWTLPAEKLPDIRKHIPDIVDRTDTEGKLDWCVTKSITATRVAQDEYEFEGDIGEAWRMLRDAGAMRISWVYTLTETSTTRAIELCKLIEKVCGIKVYRQKDYNKRAKRAQRCAKRRQ